MKLSIREFKEADLLEIHRIYLAARNNEFFKENPLISSTEFSRLLEGEETYVCEKDGRIAGFISAYLPQNFVHHFYVVPECQRQGIGKALLQYISKICETPLSLKCEKENTAAIDFYLKNGWKYFNEGSEKDGTAYILLTLNLD